jgi:hypothetical protein
MTFPTIIAIAAGLGSAVVRVVGVPVVSPSWSVMVVAPCLPILLGSTELTYSLRSTSELVVDKPFVALGEPRTGFVQQ